MNRATPVTRRDRLRLLVATAIAGVIAMTSAPARVRAAGSESTRRASGLMLNVDSRWAGGANGGYYPVRIRVANSSVPRELTFRIATVRGDDMRLPVIERRVQINASDTAQFSLAVPMVGPGINGQLRVFERGREIEPFTQPLQFPEAVLGTRDSPALLVIHPTPGAVDCTRYEAAVQSLTGGGNANNRFRMGGMVSGTRSNDYQVIDPAMLPESWIDYTALDIVAIPLATLSKLSLAPRTALLQWARAGGTLLVFETGGPAQQSTELARLLELDKRWPGRRIWTAADPATHRPIPAAALDNGLNQGMMVQAQPNAAQAEVAVDAQAAVEATNRSQWTVTNATYSHIDVMAGRVYAFAANPFPGAPIDWAWWLNSAGWSNRMAFTSRNGLSSRQKHPEFYQFLVPGVGAVPVLAFVFLITIFAILIGPVNYLFVRRRKQLYLLVLTIPILAFVTSCALFAYAMVADGFSTQSRLRSFTLLDQGTKEAIDFSRVALYSGLAPSAGLRFSAGTAVFPIWSDDETFDSGTLDWTESQHMTSGWLRSRTPTQFAAIAPRTERGGIELLPQSADAPPQVHNRFEWAIDTLVVRDESGQLYAARELPAGAQAPMHFAQPEDFDALRRPINDYRLEAPPGAATDEWSPFSAGSRRAMMARWAFGGGTTPLAFSGSTLETGLRRLNSAVNAPADGGLAPRTFLATFQENPGIEPGVQRTKSKAGVHAVLGMY